MIVNVADGPRASARMSNMAFCAQATATRGIEPILHVCCRDRNYLGLDRPLCSVPTPSACATS